LSPVDANHRLGEIDEILESLDLSRAQPGIGFLEALFLRFNARVPFENATKILRDREIADPAEKPRTPEIFWADHLELGSGGTCFARIAAFDALLSALGFSTRRLLGRVEHDGDHAGLAVAAPAGEVLADVGFPLTAVIPAGVERLETALAELAITRTARGTAVAWLDGVPEGPRGLELFSETVSEERYREHWRKTFRPDSRFLTRVAMRRNLENRSISYAEGEVRVDDRHARLRIPLAPAAAPAMLSELFGIERELLERAFALVEPKTPSIAEPRLTAYLEVAASPGEAYARIASPAGYRGLVGKVAAVIREEPTSNGFRLTLGEPDGSDAATAAAQLVDEVTPEPASRRLAVVRRTGTAEARSDYAVEERSGRTYLIREASPRASREDLLRNDSLRGRLAGALALDLLAWARLL
jgi:arylamine N-acetyltransferase